MVVFRFDWAAPNTLCNELLMPETTAVEVSIIHLLDDQVGAFFVPYRRILHPISLFEDSLSGEASSQRNYCLVYDLIE